eukprot:TRINITY_DN2682_c0_g1_i5.p1 TRINITY_DN2682_c0_g1~~TRINITY_DN2682_c0_g1_i5.p1  ORF type:complete len:371 (+),score=82.96 TRINITY_DN2682_c0_g1_i5:3-1115(+)
MAARRTVSVVESANKKEGTSSPARYQGEVLETLRHGRGRYAYANGFAYDGEWRLGVKHGAGRLEMGSCGYYEGGFVDGEIEGEGTRVWPGKYTYKGAFRLGERHGDFGVCEYPSGERYEGAWQWNKYHGKGKLILPSGDCYVGAFVNHKREGFGEYTRADCGKYEGNWVAGKRHGFGKETWPALKESYEGFWENDQFHGSGVKTSTQLQMVHHLTFDHGAPTVRAVSLASPQATQSVTVDVGTAQLPEFVVDVLDEHGDVLIGESGRVIAASLAFKRALQLSPRSLRKTRGAIPGSRDKSMSPSPERSSQRGARPSPSKQQLSPAKQVSPSKEKDARVASPSLSPSSPDRKLKKKSGKRTKPPPELLTRA